MNKGLIFVGLGFELAGLIVGSVILGQSLDKGYNLKGYATAALVLVAMLSWFLHLFYMIKRFQEETGGESDEERVKTPPNNE